MSKSEDKNQQGSSDHGKHNKDHPAFSWNQSKSDQNKKQTGGWPSQQQERRRDPDADRNRHTDPEEQIKPLRGTERNFDLLVDSVPYVVKATPFTFNGEIRYMVSFNGSPEHVFTWDSELGRLAAINDEASTLPDNLEVAISEKLQS